MAQTKSPRAQEFDSLVIGAGLSGLLAAHSLESTGRHVVLIEALDTVGGASRPAQTKAGVIDHGLKLMPATEAANTVLNWLELQLDEKIERREIEAAPVNYDGKFKPYVGFGDKSNDKPVETAAEVEAYAMDRRLLLSSTPKDWVQKLASTFTGTLLTQSIATKMTVDDSFVIETLVNGTKRITAREIVYAAPPRLLPSLLGDAAVPPRIRQKLLKGDFWTSVNLDLIHSTPVTDSESVHILKGANEEPTIGLFHPITEAGVQVSQWLTLIPSDQIDEEELVAGALKQIKRQIKRAYETAFDHVVQERIMVVPASHGTVAGAFDPPFRLPKIDNLWLASALFQTERNLLGALLQVKNLVAEIGELQSSEADGNVRLNPLSAEA